MPNVRFGRVLGVEPVGAGRTLQLGDLPFTDDHTHDASGLPSRSYNSWFELAEEAGISRLYGGIHFRSAMVRGFEQGQQIGEQISAVQFHQ